MRVSKLVLLSVFAASLTACVNSKGVSSKRFAPIKLNGSGLLDGSDYANYVDGGTNPSYACPSGYNLEPDYDWNLDEVNSNHYKVCRKKADPTKLMVYGTTRDANVVCAVPVNMQDTPDGPEYQGYLDTATPIVNGVPSSQVLSYCFNPSVQGVEVTFGNVAYSHLFISTLDYKAQLQECVYSAVYTLCPRYSFGKI